MTALTNFIVFTRGRTGSTAIVDEIDAHSRVACLQEPFIPLSGVKALMKTISEGNVDHSKLESERRFLPFEFWLHQWDRINFFGQKFYRKGLTVLGETAILRYYLAYIEQREISGAQKELSAFGFKLLVNHLNNWEGLNQIFEEDQYKVVYLERKNAVRKVISGLIAGKRGIYNRKNFTPENERHEIDLNDFEHRVRSEIILVEQEKEWLRNKPMPLLLVTYEDFLTDRESFLSEMFEFLGVGFEIPPSSEYSIMIQDLKDVIANYDDLRQRVSKMGLEHFLES